MKAFFISIPHSGEKVPAEATWLQGLPEPILMCDIDRFVDRLYAPAIRAVGCPAVIAETHRYVVDLNRLPNDIDVDSVVGASSPSGKFPRGLHWIYTTHRQTLMPKPISMAFHNELVKKYFEPFHQQVRGQYESWRRNGAKAVYHLDAHSMPSMGTSEHADPGQRRADIVVSDCKGKSCETRFKDLVIGSYETAGFKVAYNWPYVGGRVTETYGQPQIGQHAIQVELNRSLYMNEETKRLNEKDSAEVSNRISTALIRIEREL
jgi:N-formylglutamate deformylase